jgi:single-strand DNA-binding protein
MAKSLNRVTLIGNLGQDPELKQTPKGSSVCNISIATAESYKDKTTDEWKETTDWHRVVLWEKLADVAGQYLKKGDKVYIEGKLKTRDYEKDGKKVYITEVRATNLIMMGGNKADTNEDYNKEMANKSKSILDENEDLPF